MNNHLADQNLSICQIWASELDEDQYHCSMPSMYRIAGVVSHRLDPSVLMDITQLRGPHKGVWYHLCALIDIYSRYSPGWMVRASEDSVVAAEL